MVIYPHNSPIILTRDIFVEYGGLPASFSDNPLNNAFWLAEMQVSAYIGTLLLPTNVTGTYSYQGSRRLATDYGYVQQLYNVSVFSKQGYANCSLQTNQGCGYIFDDTFGYIDFKQLSASCSPCWGWPYSPAIYNYPYQIQIAYQAGLPSGTANQPGILTALTMLAQAQLNFLFPGQAGMNESLGGVGIQEFRSLDYTERRAEHALIKTALGDDAVSQRAKKLIDLSIRKARRVLLA